MSFTDSVVYLLLVTVVGFAVIMGLYLLYKNAESYNEQKLKTKAEK
jgi:hypothetical protein